MSKKRKRYYSREKLEAIRTEACRCAALVLAHRPDLDLCPKAWSLCVFFESYIEHGSDWTLKDFGPKEPVELRMVKDV